MKVISSLLQLLVVFLILTVSRICIANEVTPNKQEFESVEAYFKGKVNHINQTLLKKQLDFVSSPKQLVEFVDRALLPLWSSERTLRGLIGKPHWENLESVKKSLLQQGFNDTLQRYVQEGFGQYDGQKLEYVNVRLNRRQNRGILTIKVIPNLIPNFDVNFKIMKAKGDWLLYDAMVQGVSYISLKKDSYRDTMKKQGVNQLISVIKQKNKGYFASKYQPGLVSESDTSSPVDLSLNRD